MAAGDCTISCLSVTNILSGASITGFNTIANLSGAQLHFVPCGPQLQQIAIYKVVVA